MGREELAHLELPLCLGILVVAAVIGTSQIMQPSDAGIAVVDAFRRYGVLAGIYAEKYLLVYLLPLVRGICWGMMAYMIVLGYGYKWGSTDTVADIRASCCLFSVMIVYSSSNRSSSRRRRLKHRLAASLSLNLTSIRPLRKNFIPVALVVIRSYQPDISTLS